MLQKVYQPYLCNVGYGVTQGPLEQKSPESDYDLPRSTYCPSS